MLAAATLRILSFMMGRPPALVTCWRYRIAAGRGCQSRGQQTNQGRATRCGSRALGFESEAKAGDELARPGCCSSPVEPVCIAKAGRQQVRGPAQGIALDGGRGDRHYCCSECRPITRHGIEHPVKDVLEFHADL